MKKDAEQINIWYSQYNNLWMTCAWIRYDPLGDAGYGGTRGVYYQKDRHAHTTFEVAVKFIQERYVGSTK